MQVFKYFLYQKEKKKNKPLNGKFLSVCGILSNKPLVRQKSRLNQLKSMRTKSIKSQENR